MERYEVYIFTALCSVNFLISCLLFSKITREQKEPYMDEIFHVPQAQKYCNGKFNEWDVMITTLPGLYLVSVGLIRPLAWLVDLQGRVVCSTAMLRFINLLFNSGNLYIIYSIISKLHAKDKCRSATRRMFSAMLLSSFPVLYFFSFLYYTDAGSTFFTLFMYLMALYGSHTAAALLGICAIFFRQSNIIWVAFCAGTLVAQKLDESWRTEHQKKREEKSPSQVPLSISGVMRVMRFLFAFLKSTNHLKVVLLSTWPYISVAVGFAVFVVLNEGIVVGDRSSHEACLNIPQIFYFLSFAIFFSFPASLSYQRVIRFVQSLKKQPLLYLVLAASFLFVIWKFTVVHKYLLADNRHFPFYIWKKIFQKHEAVRFLLVPGYLFGLWMFLDTLQSKSLFWNLVFCVCVTASIVPQKLLEFRYFILPYLFYRMNITLPSFPRMLLEFGLYSAVNAVTVYIFIFKTFQWPNNDAPQRFMW